MTRARRLPLILLLPLALTACGTERPATRAALEARARAMESAVELIYVTELPGYELARQSVGVYGDDGFQSAYVSASDGATIMLSVDRGKLDAASCPKTSMASGAAKDVKCRQDGGNWYRTTADAHEYARSENGHVVRLSSDRKTVNRDTLRRAAESAHRADDQELDAVLPELGADSTGRPVERGDLPPVGDGAPDNGVGVSG
jgi:hypothetical protein